MTDPAAQLDTAPTAAVVDRVLTAQHDAVAAVRAVAPGLEAAADLVAGRVAAGGRWLFVATDAVAERVVTLAAGGLVTDFGLADGAVRWGTDLADLRPTARDAVVVVATAATHRPTVAAADRARAGVVLVTTAAADGDAEVVVAPAVEAGPVAGVTGLAVATALKVALDALTVAVLARHGRVHGDLPVDLVADDDATRARAVAMVAAVAGVDHATALATAEAAGHDVRVAVLALVGGLPLAEAARLATDHRTLRDALANLPTRLPEPPGPGSVHQR